MSDVDRSELLRAVLNHYGFQRIPEYGGNRSILCALHGDTHQSGSVNIDAGLYNCFVCDIAGDGYTIIMAQEGVDFVGAVRWLEANLDVVGGTVRSGPRREGSYLPGRSRPGRIAGRQVPAWRRRRP